VRYDCLVSGVEDLRPGLNVTPMLHLIRQIGEGGMGKVWVARHEGLETDVVVKFLAADRADRADAEARFAREAAAAAAVKSPHVVQVFDHGTTATGARYIVMELLEGHDLATHLAVEGPMAPRDVAAIIAQVSKALSKAHQAGVIHRDIKPENIFLCDGDGGEMFVKVLDFGIAKREEHASSKTTTGQVVGTPYYMSPEQLLGEPPLDTRTDIWSLGVVAFEALTGRRPFDGATVGSITLAIHQATPRPSAFRPGIPAAVDEWFARACAHAPKDRFATAREAGQAILSAVGDPTTTPGMFRVPTMSIADASDPSLLPPMAARADAQPRTITSLSTSFATSAQRRRTRWTVAVAVAIAAVAVVAGLLVVIASRGGDAEASTSASAAPPTAAPTVSALAEPASAVSSASSAAPAELQPPVMAPVSTSAPAPAIRPKTTPAARPKRPLRKANDDDIK
jgi:serine/threonine-protein kinase